MGTKVKITWAFILDALIGVLEFIRNRVKSSSTSTTNGTEYRPDVNENTDAKSKLTDYIKDKIVKG